MNIEPVILDEAAAAKLAAANGHAIPLQGPDGGVVAFGGSPERLETLERAYRESVAQLRRTWTPDEIRRLEEARKDDPRPNISHQEVLRWLEAQ